MTNALKTWPERIYLMQHEAEFGAKACHMDGTTEYVRADLIPAAPVAGSEREAFERSGLDLCSTNEGNWGVWQRAWQAALSQPSPLQALADQAQELDMGYGANACPACGKSEQTGPKELESHTVEECFQHFLSYSGLSGETADIVEKMRRAFDAANARPDVDVPFTESQITAVARALANRSADACNLDREDNWKMFGEEFIGDARAAIAALASSQQNGGV